MVYGYCRASTHMQAKDRNSLKVQEKLLLGNGAKEIYAGVLTVEKPSSRNLPACLANFNIGIN